MLTFVIVKTDARFNAFVSINVYIFQVLQRKTEEAAMATKRLKELLEARKTSSRETSGLIFLYRQTMLIFINLIFSPAWDIKKSGVAYQTIRIVMCFLNVSNRKDCPLMNCRVVSLIYCSVNFLINFHLSVTMNGSGTNGQVMSSPSFSSICFNIMWS